MPYVYNRRHLFRQNLHCAGRILSFRKGPSVPFALPLKTPRHNSFSREPPMSLGFCRAAWMLFSTLSVVFCTNVSWPSSTTAFALKLACSSSLFSPILVLSLTSLLVFSLHQNPGPSRHGHTALVFQRCPCCGRGCSCPSSRLQEAVFRHEAWGGDGGVCCQ